jgi:pimeloyl-ACP methyl ester carboxylesterase
MTTIKLVAVSAALVVSLAGCGSDPKPAADAGQPTPSATPSVTPSDDSDTASAGLVDVGAHSLYAECPDEGTGPTVVFLHGLGGAGEDWLPTIRGAGDARTCWYDRLNVGRSDADPMRHTALDSVTDLHALLAEVGGDGPYILVGHSYGGLLAEMYAGKYPDEVSGLVLVDSTLTLETELDPPSSVPAVMAEMDANGENLDAYEGYAQARQLEANLPDIPVHYILAEEMDLPAEWSEADYRRRLAAWVDSLPQGELVSCPCDHAIPLNAPAVIAEEIQSVKAATGE